MYADSQGIFKATNFKPEYDSILLVNKIQRVHPQMGKNTLKKKFP